MGKAMTRKPRCARSAAVHVSAIRPRRTGESWADSPTWRISSRGVKFVNGEEFEQLNQVAA